MKKLKEKSQHYISNFSSKIYKTLRNFEIKWLYVYIAQNFLYRFLGVSIGIALLVFIINLFDSISYTKEAEQVSWIIALTIALYKVPSFLEDISIFLVMLSVMLTLYNFSTKSEVTIMRASGMSLWQILLPMIVTSFIIGILFILFFNPLTIATSKRASALEQQYSKIAPPSDILKPAQGIWLRQKNLIKNSEEIVIRARSINKKTLELSDVNLWFFDVNGRFYQKVDAQNMYLLDDYWQLNNIIINSDFNINQNLPEFKVLTNLKSSFIAKKIINNFEDVKSFSVYELPGLIFDLEDSGFPSRKFRVYYHSLLNKPFIFVAAVLIACFFSLNSSRNKNSIIYTISGIMFGLVLYISLSIIQAFGASGLIPPFASTWIISIIIISLSVILVFWKEQN